MQGVVYMLEDRQLVWKLKRGDRQAMQRLYEKYKDQLLTTAAALVGLNGEAEDIIHDVFVSFAAGITKFEPYGSLRSYLLTCVVNRARDVLRRRKFEMRRISRLAETAVAGDNPQQTLILDEQSRQVMEALNEIPFEQREVIVLHLNAGMKFREIAVLQNTSMSTVQGRYRYGLQKLRSVLQGEAGQ